jgi:hypothetical protein
MFGRGDSRMAASGDLLSDTGPTDLADDQLVRAIIRGKAPYAELLRRSPNRVIAARFYAFVASATFAATHSASECEVCGRPGKNVTLRWKATLLRRGENLVKALILLPFVFLAILIHVHGKTIHGPNAIADHVDFQTCHVLCCRCRPGILRRLGVGILNGVVCLLSLAALVAFAFTGTCLVFWMSGPKNTGADLALAVLPWFLASAAILLSHLARWPRRIARVISLPQGLRGLASGPFELETGSSFRLVTARAKDEIEV